MNSVELFKMALGLQSPWYVEKVEFANKSKNVRELNIHIEFTKGAKFKDTKGVDSCVHDTVKRRWSCYSMKKRDKALTL